MLLLHNSLFDVVASCDVTAAFTDAENLWYASSHSVIKAFCFVWPMIPPATFLDHFTRVSCQVQQHWRIQCWEATPYFSGIIEHNLKYGLRSSHQRRMLCFLFIPHLYSTILKHTIIDVWCHLVSHQFGTTAIKQRCKKLEKNVRNCISFQDYLSWCASQKLFLSPKLISSNNFFISIVAFFTTSIFRKKFITSCTSIDEEKANDWFFLSGSQNEMESLKFLIRRLLISLLFRSASSFWLIMSLMSGREDPLPWSNYRFYERKIVLEHVFFLF